VGLNEKDNKRKKKRVVSHEIGKIN
jgi:hypothetical protein